MWTIQNDAEIKRIERERALVGVYVDRAYDREKIRWVMDAREGFDTHVGDSWHLLIPVRNGYGIDTWVEPEHYGTQLAAQIIDTLEINYVDLPCIVFRAKDENFYFLKLGDKNRNQFFEEIRAYC
mgnify:FL=1